MHLRYANKSTVQNKIKIFRRYFDVYQFMIYNKTAHCQIGEMGLTNNLAMDKRLLYRGRYLDKFMWFLNKKQGRLYQECLFS